MEPRAMWGNTRSSALSLRGFEPNGDGDERQRNAEKKSRAVNIGERVIGHGKVAPVTFHVSCVQNDEV